MINSQSSSTVQLSILKNKFQQNVWKYIIVNSALFLLPSLHNGVYFINSLPYLYKNKRIHNILRNKITILLLQKVPIGTGKLCIGFTIEYMFSGKYFYRTRTRKNALKVLCEECTFY